MEGGPKVTIYRELMAWGGSRENDASDPREQGAWPKIRVGAGSKENVIWEQGAQKLGKGSREQQEILEKEQEKLSGRKRKN